MADSGPAKTFTIISTGTIALTLSGVTTSGGNAGDFTVDTTGMASPVAPASSTTFAVTFTPTGSGPRGTTLQIFSDDEDESPFDIALTGTGLSFTADGDGDGLNDASEFRMAALGFNWQLPQPALVNTYHTNANGAGLFNQAQCDASRQAGRDDVINSPNTYQLYTLSQVQALNVGVPLLQRDPVSGQFTLTIGVQKSTNLHDFLLFPMSAPQVQVNGAGKLEFRFPPPDNAAFFRLESR